MRIFVSAGEASGDAYGAALVKEIRQRLPSELREELHRAIYATEIARHPSPHRPNEFQALQLEDTRRTMSLLWQLADEFGVEWGIEEESSLQEALEAVLSQSETFVRRVIDALDGPFEGLGGPRMKAEGVLLVADSSHWGAISIAHALPLVRRVLGSYYRAKRALSTGTPGLFVPIDFGYVNIRLARHAKARGWRVLYFVPPGSWRRHKQGKDLPSVTHAIVTPFSWSADILERMGANVRWFGHPIKSLLQRGADVSPAARQVLAVLPGSRAHEIDNNLPILAEALKDWPHPVEFALAPSTDAESIRSRWPRKEDTFTIGDTVGVLRRARAAIVCSGTATLEAALLRVPTVVVYQADDKMRREERILTRLGLFRRPEYVALPNILLEKPAVPEMIDRVDPIALRTKVERLWEDGPERQNQIADFEELDRILGPADAIAKTAEWALELMAK